MPANLPPQYLEIERKLKTAASPEEKIIIYEELLRLVPKHKGTEKLQAMMKSKMAKLKNLAQKKTVTARHGAGHKVKPSGAGQVIIIGAPNSGKSQLLQALTDAKPLISENPFSTHDPYPAMMSYDNIHIQLVDTPPVTPDYMEDWIPDLIKSADAVLLMLDLAAGTGLETFLALVERLSAKRIVFSGRPLLPREKWERGTCRIKTLVAANKNDLLEDPELLELYRAEIDPAFEIFPVSALTGDGLGMLRKEIFNMLEIIRVYSKTPGHKAELINPFTLAQGSNVMDMAKLVHKDFADNFNFARIWGNHAYDGQRVNRSHILEDEDIIELHT